MVERKQFDGLIQAVDWFSKQIDLIPHHDDVIELPTKDELQRRYGVRHFPPKLQEQIFIAASESARKSLPEEKKMDLEESYRIISNGALMTYNYERGCWFDGEYNGLEHTLTPDTRSGEYDYRCSSCGVGVKLEDIS